MSPSKEQGHYFKRTLIGYIGFPAHAVPVLGLPPSGLIRTAQLFNFGNGIPMNRVPLNHQGPHITEPCRPDQCTPLMNWVNKHEVETRDLAQFIQKYRGAIDGYIGENKYRELEIDDLRKRVMQLNRELIQVTKQMERLVYRYQVEVEENKKENK